MADPWDDAVKAAMKVLGDQGKIPKLSPKIGKATDVYVKAYEEFSKQRTVLRDKLVALQDSVSASKNALAQFQDDVEEDDFGLEPKKNKDDQKKINEARKILSEPLQTRIDIQDENLDNLQDLDKHLANIMNYRQAT